MAIHAGNAVARVRWPQPQQVPLGGLLKIYRNDGAGGDVDYGAVVAQVPAWPDGAGKIGAGLGRGGQGAAGFGDGGIGAGLGAAGLGLAGFGAAWQQAAVGPLPDGTYALAACGVDAAGNVVTPADETAGAALAGTPRPASDFSATAYNPAGPSLTLGWTKSPDDTS